MKEPTVVAWGWPKSVGDYMSQLYVKYRMTRELYDQIWKRQEGKCAGCRREFAYAFIRAPKQGVKPQVDHKHGTNEPQWGNRCEAKAIRGLLCSECNGLLGRLADDRERLQRLVDYLKSHGDWL